MNKLKLCVLVFCVLLFVALLPTVAAAADRVVMYVESDILTDTTWHEGDYYICHVGDREPIVKEGVTLTIESGSNVYFGNRGNEPIPDTDNIPYSCLTVNGTLIANDVTFTTIPDNEVVLWCQVQHLRTYSLMPQKYVLLFCTRHHKIFKDFLELELYIST